MAPSEQSFDLVVVGGGPGGYVAAIRASQLGLKTACVEADATLGGTCLNVGCIPSKALLDSTELFDVLRHQAKGHGITIGKASVDLDVMMSRKAEVVASLTDGVEKLFKKNSITRVAGIGRLLSTDRLEVTAPDGSKSTVRAEKIILATGSEPIPFPDVPFDEKRVLSSTGALSLAAVPVHLVVIGAGIIGLELGSVWLRLGAKVTVLEKMPTILPGFDDDVVKAADRAFKKQGFDIRTSVSVAGIESTGKGVTVKLEEGEAVRGDHVLVAVGRRPRSVELGLEAVGIETSAGGAIIVDDRYHTGAGEVYAVGDAIGGLMLAHEAEEEGIAAAENMGGGRGHVTYDAIAGVVYTAPEIASVGKTEAQAREAGYEIRTGRFPFAANGRALAMAETDGFVKVIADALTDRLLGVHIIGPRASDLIAEASLAMEFGASAEDIAVSVHAHPTLPEVVKEAALASLGRAIHI